MGLAPLYDGFPKDLVARETVHFLGASAPEEDLEVGRQRYERVGEIVKQRLGVYPWVGWPHASPVRSEEGPINVVPGPTHGKSGYTLRVAPD